MVAVEKMKLDGLDAVSLKTGQLELVAVSQFGPRIASLSLPGGENLLLWEPGKYFRDDWELRGGHRVWMTRPGADECEDTYALDNDPCEVELFDNGFRVTGPKNPSNCTRRGIEVRVVGENKLTVDNFCINTGEMLYSGGLWALTCTVPGEGTRYGVPIGDGSCWDAFTMVAFREWGGHGAGGFNDPQVTVGGDMVLLDPVGVENKRMIQSHHGVIAMSDPSRNLTFAKKIGFDSAGQYPLNTNIAFYIGPDNFMVEMETMGPESTLKPGAEIHHVETWVLASGAIDLDTAKASLALFA